ncbi:hypothetical protein JCM10207_003804 [Rhodosporidiobolus poonsookiae]
MTVDQSELDGFRDVFERQLLLLRNSYGSEAVPITSKTALKDCEAGALQDKVVLITGASSGFGAELAKRAAKHGAKVVVAAIANSGLDKVVEEIQQVGGEVTSLDVDVSKWADQVALFEHAEQKYDRIDIVFANAGIYERGNLLESKTTAEGKLEEPTLETLDVDVRGSIYTSKLAFHYFTKHQWNKTQKLIITGSLGSWLSAPGCPVYGTACHARLGLFRALNNDAEGKNLDVTMIAPGPVPTAIWGNAMQTMVGQLPHAKLSDTVDAMLAAAAGGYAGKILATDTIGIFQIPNTVPQPAAQATEIKKGDNDKVDEKKVDEAK